MKLFFLSGLCLFLGSCGAFVVLVIQPGSSGVVASLRLADGSEYMVTQRCNWEPDPYTVSFFMRSASSQQWGWCYIDHETNPWSAVVMSYNPATDVITVTKRGVWQAALDRKRGMFSIGDGEPRRELPAPQELRPPDFAFP